MNLRDLYAQQLSERGFRADPVQASVVAQLDDLRHRLIAAREPDASIVRRWFSALGNKSATEPVRGIYLWGGVGRGKTWMMDLFYQSLPFPERRRKHFHRFMHDVHAELKALHQRESPLEVVADHIAQDTRVLCFDEFFVSDIADAMILGGLFAALFKRGVTLVATSNVEPHNLYKDGLQRQRFLPTIDLLVQHLDVVAVDGTTDYRLRRLTQAGTYLPSSAPDTVRRLQMLFDELADHDGDDGGTDGGAGLTDGGARLTAAGRADGPAHLTTAAHSDAAARLTAAEHPDAAARLTAAEHPGAAARLTAAEHPDAAARLTAAEHPDAAAHLTGAEHPDAAAHLTGANIHPTRGADATAPESPPTAARTFNQSGRPWPNHSPINSARSIEIEGRLIPVVRERGGVVWFDFMALCSGPRSQEDYIEIARDYQSVIVSDIPVLDSLHEDEARRLIALVDELYDRNVNLIVSAAAAPVELYRGERVAFQFERTASRLIEMQSEEYLAREHRP